MPQSALSNSYGKLKHVDRNDGWTQVVRPPCNGRVRNPRRSEVKGANGLLRSSPRLPEIKGTSTPFSDVSDRWETFISNGIREISTASGTEIPDDIDYYRENDYTVEELEEHFASREKAWRASPERARIRHLVEQRLPLAPTIKQSVCLGLGTLSRMNFTMCPLIQLVVWLDIGEMLARMSDTPVSYIAQDPAFRQEDRQFLFKHKIVVLDQPHGLDAIDDHTFVYAPHCPLLALRKELVSWRGSLMVCNDLEVFQEQLPKEKDIALEHAHVTAVYAEIPPALRAKMDWDLRIHDNFEQYLAAHDHRPFITGETYGSNFWAMNMYQPVSPEGSGSEISDYEKEESEEKSSRARILEHNYAESPERVLRWEYLDAMSKSWVGAERWRRNGRKFRDFGDFGKA